MKQRKAKEKIKKDNKPCLMQINTQKNLTNIGHTYHNNKVSLISFTQYKRFFKAHRLYMGLLLLVTEVLSSKSQRIKASPQAWRYFNPGNKAALQRMLPDWACAQRSTVG